MKTSSFSCYVLPLLFNLQRWLGLNMRVAAQRQIFRRYNRSVVMREYTFLFKFIPTVNIHYSTQPYTHPNRLLSIINNDTKYSFPNLYHFF